MSKKAVFKLDNVTRSLRCKLTKDEMLEAGKCLAEHITKVRSLEEDKRKVNAEYTAQIQRVEADITIFKEKVGTGCESREIECKQVPDLPKDGKKTIVRSDTGESIGAEDMTQEELQGRLDFETESQTAEAPVE